MENLTTYIQARKPDSMRVIADDLGVSRPYLHQLASGERTPSLEVAQAIETATSGKVPAASWPNLAKLFAAVSKGMAGAAQ